MARGRSPGYDDQRELILSRAEQLFAQRGYSATSMNEVAEACGMSKPALDDRVPALLERVGLGGAARRRVKTFSKGMVQRLGLAQALLHEPELLVLDEPTTGLDPEGRRLVAELVSEQKRRGTAVLLSSHILTDVERVCDRVVILRRGKVVLSDRVAAVTATQSLEDVYMQLAGGSSDG